MSLEAGFQLRLQDVAGKQQKSTVTKPEGVIWCRIELLVFKGGQTLQPSGRREGTCVCWVDHVQPDDGLGADSGQRCWGFYAAVSVPKGKSSSDEWDGLSSEHTHPCTYRSSKGMNTTPNRRTHWQMASNSSLHIHHHKHEPEKWVLEHKPTIPSINLTLPETFIWSRGKFSYSGKKKKEYQ